MHNSMGTDCRATERQLSIYGITQCYLPPDEGKRMGCKAELKLVGGYIPNGSPVQNSHPST